MSQQHTGVVCASCKTVHGERQDVYGPGQAEGCAATVAHDGIRTYYGSNHDGDQFAWVDRPDWVQDGQVCDACIDRLVADGAAQPTKEWSPDYGCYLVSLLPDDEAAQRAHEAEMERLYGPDDTPVHCASCETRHDRVISARSRQAYGCAAEATDKGVTGAYGSYVCDLEHRPWARDDSGATRRPDWVKDGVICDTCINRLQADGAFAKPRAMEAFPGSVGLEDLDDDADVIGSPQEPQNRTVH